MLSIGAMGSGQGDYYLSLAREDYYLNGGEPPGVWLGQGAQSLGLTGMVDAGALTRLLEGFHPEENGGALIQNAGAKDHQPGWDLTFSAPKSVSVLWSQADPQVRKIIEDCHFAAVKTALGFIEETSAITRRGKGGHIKEDAQLIIAAFEHGTSRAQDPQLHTHCLVMNVCTREDGTSGTIESKLLYLAKMATGALYRAEFAVLLEKGLGVTVERKGSCFEIGGVPEDLMTEFSKRRGEIDMLLEEKGYESSAAAAMAALATRQTKTFTPREQLFDEWQETGQKFNWGPEQAADFLREAQSPLRDPKQEKEAALLSAMKRSTDEKSYFNEREFIRYVAEEAQGRGFGAHDVRQISKSYLEQSPEIVPLGVYKHENLYSTREMMAIERSLIHQVQKSKSQFHEGVSEQVLKGVVGARHRLNEEQAAALRHVCDSGPGSIRIVSGMAGTGKTTFLDAARFAWTLEGFQVHGFALPGKAAKGLGTGTHIKHDTLHRTLWNLESGKLRLTPKSVLVLDEAGMVGTRQMEKLMTAASKTGARLVV
ncbi:MAG: MobF family relaxase, partial [Armatimonadota bacterium]